IITVPGGLDTCRSIASTVGSPTVLAIDRHVSSPPGTVIIGIPILAPGLGQVYTHPHPVEPQCCSFSLWEPPSSPEGCSCCLREKSRTGTSCLSSHSSDTSPTITPGRLIWLCHCLDLPPRHPGNLRHRLVPSIWCRQ